MAAKIRLKRLGKKGKPYFRIVVMDESFNRDGKTIANLGLFDPQLNPPKIKINKNLLRYWLSQGATPTDSVRRLLDL